MQEVHIDYPSFPMHKNYEILVLNVHIFDKAKFSNALERKLPNYMPYLAFQINQERSICFYYYLIIPVTIFNSKLNNQNI